MKTPTLVDWHGFLWTDFQTLLADFPLEMIGVAKHKAQQLIADDHCGFKLCWAGQLSTSVALPFAPHKLLRQLHLIYLCAWLVYGIYDDINDGESRSKHLPLANYVLLRLLQLSRQLYTGGDYQPIMMRHLQVMEAANYQELHLDAYQNFPQNLLFERASGQLFALDVLADYWRLSTKEHHKLFRFARDLLSILQIQDDLRDWQEDYQAKRMTYVNQKLLYLAKNNSAQIKEHFYLVILPNVLADLSVRISAARNLLRSLPQFAVQRGFFNLILSSCAKILVNDQTKSALLQQQYTHQTSP